MEGVEEELGVVRFCPLGEQGRIENRQAGVDMGLLTLVWCHSEKINKTKKVCKSHTVSRLRQESVYTYMCLPCLKVYMCSQHMRGIKA